MKPFLINELASEEFREAVRWYEERRPGWGGKLFDAVGHTVDLILAHPEIGAERAGRHSSRQLQVLGFPYTVAYAFESTTSTSSRWHTRSDGLAIGKTVPD